MNKNAATEREYEFSYDTLVDIITAQQALIEELTHTIFAKEKELEKNTDLLNDAKWLIDDLMYACEMNEIIFDFPEKDLSYSRRYRNRKGNKSFRLYSRWCNACV